VVFTTGAAYGYLLGHDDGRLEAYEAVDRYYRHRS
jgi:hypothetical protein